MGILIAIGLTILAIYALGAACVAALYLLVKAYDAFVNSRFYQTIMILKLLYNGEVELINATKDKNGKWKIDTKEKKIPADEVPEKWKNKFKEAESKNSLFQGRPSGYLDERDKETKENSGRITNII